jgi:hypothetical protein
MLLRRGAQVGQKQARRDGRVRGLGWTDAAGRRMVTTQVLQRDIFYRYKLTGLERTLAVWKSSGNFAITWRQATLTRR